MTTRFHHLAVLVAALVATLAYSPLARAADPPISLGEAYKQVKDAERSIPIPTPVETRTIGTFDAATGAFDGLATEIEIVNGKPVRLVPELSINAVNARLVFEIVNATQSVRVTATGGGSAFARAGATSVALNVGRLRTVKWTISSGGKAHRDELTIKRPRTIGAGAFTIPALPVAVVYDPPQDPAGSNSVVYTRTTSIGTTLGLTVRSATSTTAAAVSPTFSESGIFQQQLEASAAFADVTGNGTVGTVLRTIGRVLGKAKRNVTTSSDGSSTNRRTYTFTESHSCSTDTGVKHLGPGRGDRIAYLRNVRLVWLDNGFSTSLQVLGYDSFECPSIDQLRSGVAGLDPAAAAPLVALDPFAGPLGPKAPLSSDSRFIPLPGIGLLPGLVQTATYQQQLLVEHGRFETSTRIVSDDLGAGLLSVIGLAPSESKQVVSTLSVSSSAETSESTTVTTALTARTLVKGVRTELAVFYDRVFGTIAFQDPRP
jgi:hypothetical protein